MLWKVLAVSPSLAHTFLNLEGGYIVLSSSNLFSFSPSQCFSTHAETPGWVCLTWACLLLKDFLVLSPVGEEGCKQQSRGCRKGSWLLQLWISGSYISQLLLAGGAGGRRLATGREKLEYFLYLPLTQGGISSNSVFPLCLQVQLDRPAIISVSPVCPQSRDHSIVVACYC